MIRARTSIALTLIGTVVLAGCTTGPVMNPDDPNRRTKTGAAIGAGVGAIAGRLVGNDGDVGQRNRATAAGALIGAAAGGAIGMDLDRQAAELRADLESDSTVENTGDSLIVTMPQDILFATDSAAVRTGLQGDIRTVAQSLLEYPDTTVQVIGHTDDTGGAEYNQTLSERRADAVTAILRSEGVASSRLRAIGRGEDDSIASNLTAEGRAQNRRVEIVIVPNA